MVRKPVVAGLLALCLPLVATLPARGEPRPGTVAGLDLGGPLQAARSFVTAWDEGDYFVAYLALDPQLRLRFQRAIQRFDFRDILGEPLTGEALDRTTELMAESAISLGSAIAVDTFAYFSAYLQAGAEIGFRPLVLPEVKALETAAMIEIDGPEFRIGRLALPRGGAMVFRQSPDGRWRLLGFEGVPGLPEMWIYPEP